MDLLWFLQLLALESQNLGCLFFGVIFWGRSQLIGWTDNVRVETISYFVQVLLTNWVSPGLSHLHIESRLGGFNIYYGSLEFPQKQMNNKTSLESASSQDTVSRLWGLNLIPDHGRGSRTASCRLLAVPQAWSYKRLVVGLVETLEVVRFSQLAVLIQHGA